MSDVVFLLAFWRVDESCEPPLKALTSLCLDAWAEFGVLLGSVVLGMDGAVADALVGNHFPNSLLHLRHGPELASSGL